MDNASVIHSAPLSPLQRQSIICIQPTTIQSVQPATIKFLSSTFKYPINLISFLKPSELTQSLFQPQLY